jgi:hypothetical protein
MSDSTQCIVELINNIEKKLKLSHYTPWTRLGEEV